MHAGASSILISATNDAAASMLAGLQQHVALRAGCVAVDLTASGLDMSQVVTSWPGLDQSVPGVVHMVRAKGTR